MYRVMGYRNSPEKVSETETDPKRPLMAVELGIPLAWFVRQSTQAQVMNGEVREIHEAPNF